MSWKVLLSSKAARNLRKIPKEYMKGVKVLLLRLRETPFPRGYIKLKDIELFRVRFGRVRILYRVDHKNKVVLIFKIGLRNEETYRRI